MWQCQYFCPLFQQQGRVTSCRGGLLRLEIWPECLHPQRSGNASAPCLLGYCQSNDRPLWRSACPQTGCRLLVLDKLRSQRTGQCQGLALLAWYWSHAGNAQDREPSCPLHHHFAQITIKAITIWDGQISLRQSVKGLSD